MMAKLKLISLRDVKPKPVEWLWEPYIPLGKISIIQGDGGEGKTTLSLALAAAITKGEALLGQCAATLAQVVIHNAEDNLEDTTSRRLKLFGADIDKVHFIDDEDESLTFMDERIEQAIIERGAKLLILDPIQAYFGGVNMNSAGSVRPIMKRLAVIASRHKCAILLVGHLGKKGSRAQYRGLGSIDIFAAARSVLTVGRIPLDEDMRAFVQIKNNLAPIGKSQAFGIDQDGAFCWLGECDATIEDVDGKKREDKFAKARKFIETTLANGPVSSVDVMEMAEIQGISEKTLKRAKSALGVVSIKQQGRWYWQIPIDVEFSEVGQEEGGQQEGHEGSPQEGHVNQAPMASLTLFRGGEVS